jgi:pimeloyl-ACP methyl ester carboxylesterase
MVFLLMDGACELCPSSGRGAFASFARVTRAVSSARQSASGQQALPQCRQRAARGGGRAASGLSGAWGVDLDAVSAPAALWSGACDVVHPTAHARWLAARLRDAPVAVVPEAATFGMLAIYADALRFAAAAVLR